jgi:hypothetical protein
MRITALQSLQFVWYFEPRRRIENSDVTSLVGTAHPHVHSEASATMAAHIQFAYGTAWPGRNSRELSQPGCGVARAFDVVEQPLFHCSVEGQLEVALTRLAISSLETSSVGSA